MTLSEPKKITDLVKDLTDEEIAAVEAEKARRQAEKDRAIQERGAYLRFQAYAVCNRCHRPLTEDTIRKQAVCPYCGSESATLIDHGGDAAAEEAPK